MPNPKKKIYTDKKLFDKANQAYQDSLTLYNGYIKANEKFKKEDYDNINIDKNAINIIKRTKYKPTHIKLAGENKNIPFNQINDLQTIESPYISIFKKPTTQPVFQDTTDNKMVNDFNKGTGAIIRKNTPSITPVNKIKNTTTLTKIPTRQPIKQEVNIQPTEEAQYQSWRSKLPKNLQYEGDYDLKGFWKENPTWTPDNTEVHMTDKFKLPNHPTFSNESKYYKPGMKAVRWEGDTPIPIQTQKYTASKYLQLKGKPSGYINEGNKQGRKEYADGGWLDELEGSQILPKDSTQYNNAYNSPSNQGKVGFTTEKDYLNNWFSSQRFKDKIGTVNPDSVSNQAVNKIKNSKLFYNPNDTKGSIENYVDMHTNTTNQDKKELLKHKAVGKSYKDSNDAIITKVEGQNNPNSISIHELTHLTNLDELTKSKFKPALYQDKYGTTRPFNRVEAYPSLMQFRYDNNFKPDQVITPEDMKNIRNKGYKNILDDKYTDDEILNYLNTVADNSTPNKNIMAKGGWLNQYGDGGEMWMGNKLNSQGYVTSDTKSGNRISFTGDTKADDWVNKQVDTGKFGYDPKTKTVIKLNKPVKGLSTTDKIIGSKKYAQATEAEKFAMNPELRKQYVQKSTEEAFKNPLMYAPGMVGMAGLPIAFNSAYGLSSALGNLGQGNYKTAGLEAGLSMLPYAGPGINAAKSSLANSMESGLLSNTHKLNPWAFKPNPEAYYRGIGRSGLDDAIESGVLRTANKTGNYGEDLYMTSDFRVAKGNYSKDRSTYTGDPFGNHNDWKEILPKDSKSYIAEIPKNAVTNLENPGSTIYFNKGSLPLKDVKLLKEDWLRGYKPIKTPNVGKQLRKMMSPIDDVLTKPKFNPPAYIEPNISKITRPYIDKEEEIMERFTGSAKGEAKRTKYYTKENAPNYEQLEQMRKTRNYENISKPELKINLDESKKISNISNQNKTITKFKKFSVSDYLDRRQHVKKLINQGLVDPKTDILKYSKNLEDIEDLTKRAIDYQNTYYRGVTPKIPKNLDEYIHHGKSLSKNQLAEIKNQMIKGGVDLNNEESIGKYMAEHVPLHQFGYRSGVDNYINHDALYVAKGKSSYGDMTFKLKKPSDYSKGSYKDWLNKHNSSEPNLENFVKEKYESWVKTNPNSSYYEFKKQLELPKWIKNNSGNFIGKKGERIFDNAERVTDYGRNKINPLPFKLGGWLDNLK